MTLFRSDCGNCCGLCCVVPDQLALQGFPEDKPAEIPCINLDDELHCSIHAERCEHGYQACRSFDCFGAGQWITQELFDGARWTDSAETAAAMFAAYRHWLPRFEAAAMIEAALPMLRDEVRPSMMAHMIRLVSDADDSQMKPGDTVTLRRQTSALIRAALQ